MTTFMFKQMAESVSNLHKAVAFTLKILFPPGGKTTKAQQQALQSLALLVASEEVLQKGAMHEPEKRALTAQCVKNWCAQILQHPALVRHAARFPAETAKLAVFTDIKLTNPYDPDPATATLIERIKKLKAGIRNNLLPLWGGVLKNMGIEKGIIPSGKALEEALQSLRLAVWAVEVNKKGVAKEKKEAKKGAPYQ